jgi:DNA-binding NarL/FixJ family response regulator
MEEGGSPQILLVDDHPMMRAMLRIACEAEGLTVVAEAADGAEAVAQTRRWDPDVVVLDLVLPRMSGFDVIREIKASGAKARILVLTGSDQSNALFEALSLGVEGFLEKSLPVQEIVAAVRAVASGQVAVSDVQERQARSQLRDMARSANNRAREATRFSRRALEVLSLMAEGITNRQIATSLGIAPSTVQGYISALYRELEVESRVQAVRRGLALGVIEPPPPREPRKGSPVA